MLNKNFKNKTYVFIFAKIECSAYFYEQAYKVGLLVVKDILLPLLL